ncbi:hypothetical protein FOVSG1_007199 [Fusarium oxysporum f. sp. vasinfectum]
MLLGCPWLTSKTVSAIIVHAINRNTPAKSSAPDMRVAEKMMFMGLPHFKDTQSQCKECNRKVDGPGQISVGYQLRKNNVLFMTVRPVPPKSKCK